MYENYDMDDIELEFIHWTCNEEEALYEIRYMGEKYLITMPLGKEPHDKLYECWNEKGKKLPKELEGFVETILSREKKRLMNKKAVKKYRKKPIVIEAYQTDKVMYIETLEGIHKADIGDYIITGVKGEQYPCKPDIFEQTYEPMEDLKGSKSTPLNWSKSTSLDGWISVKDRLPEEYKEVLAYDINRQKEKIKEFDKKNCNSARHD